MDAYRAITSLPNVLDQFFDKLALQMGWVFTVLAEGLEPVNGGNIRTLEYVVTVANVSCVSLPAFFRYDCGKGKNNAGLTFGTAHPSFQTSFLKPFTAFVKQVFCESSLHFYWI